MSGSRNRITAITRRKLFDSISLAGTGWSGRLQEPDFLGRIYDLSSLPSMDKRYDDAYGDIWQHRVNNYDWEDDWVFSDSRFNLAHGDDAAVLAFLAEMLHPLVRSDESEVGTLLSGFNEALARDGYQLYASDWISGHAIYGWRRLDAFHGSAPELRLTERPLTDSAVLGEHLKRIRTTLAEDPAAAISSCKNLLESLFKIILDGSERAYGTSEDLPRLYRKVADLLALNAESVPTSARASQTSQQILRTLVTTVSSLAELRNELGIGHGQTSRSAALARHARLALNATVTVAEFVLDTWQVRIESGGLEKAPASKS
ncbi:abortive infection family protein [Frigoribacterium sp. CFBP 8754]|uniref:abortive infection family protein n=1 Tax=Frigoribacterium sp. CFBP 8754 TaxID=2775290 RepID=UPI001783765C|nr:abortive infection family protein [Frigoribacterium sp. CFBP 8754]MBD8661479.1 abortive infection family protein [Frigoribacterium sp. CFBP 8754]